MEINQKFIDVFMTNHEFMPLEKCENEIDFQIYAAEQLIKAIFKIFNADEMDEDDWENVQDDIDLEDDWDGLHPESLLNLLSRNGLALTWQKTDETDDAYWKLRSLKYGIEVAKVEQLEIA